MVKHVYHIEEATVDNYCSAVTPRKRVHGGFGRADIAVDCESIFGGFNSRRSPERAVAH